MSPESKHQFTLTVNNKTYMTSVHELTGSQIKDLAGVPQDYELFQVQGANTTAIGNEQQVHIHEKIEFRAIPAGTFGIRLLASA